MILQNKIDFALVFEVKNANPNGDPLNGNRPRLDYDGCGEVSDVCLKRKIRNRLQDMGETIFVQSDDRRDDGYRSLRDRADADKELKGSDKDKEKYAAIACKKWIDVRAFGQVFSFKPPQKAKNKGNADETGQDNSKDKGVSIGVRGPVSIHCATSAAPIDILSTQITKSVNSETGADPDKKSSDTMGLKHRVPYGAYVTYGSINTQLAAKTGFSEEDAEKIRQALCTLFENDVSSARPGGSMEVLKVYWWKHNSSTGQYSSAKVHRSLVVEVDRIKKTCNVTHVELDGLTPEIYDGV